MITYRLQKGAPLTIEELDDNFRNLDGRVKILESYLESGEGIGKIISQEDSLTIIGSRGTEFGTFPLPKASFSHKGKWAPEVAYTTLDMVVYGANLYYCLHSHRSSDWERDVSLWYLMMSFAPPPLSPPLYEKATLPVQSTLGMIAVLFDEKSPSLIFFDGEEWKRIAIGDPL